MSVMILNRESNADERRQIEARFADARPPNGELEFVANKGTA